MDADGMTHYGQRLFPGGNERLRDHSELHLTLHFKTLLHRKCQVKSLDDISDDISSNCCTCIRDQYKTKRHDFLLLTFHPWDISD